MQTKGSKRITEKVKQMPVDLSHQKVNPVKARRAKTTSATTKASVQQLKRNTRTTKSYNREETLSKTYYLRERHQRKCCGSKSASSSVDEKVRCSPAVRRRVLNGASSFLSSKVYVEVSAKFDVIQLINEEMKRLGLAGSSKRTEVDENKLQKTSVGTSTTLNAEQAKLRKCVQVTTPTKFVDRQCSPLSTDANFVIIEENNLEQNSVKSVLDDASSNENLSVNFEASDSDPLSAFFNDEEDEAFEKIVNKTYLPPPSEQFQCRLCDDCFVSNRLLNVHTLRSHMDEFLKSVTRTKVYKQHEDQEFTAIHNNGDFLSSANFSDTVSVMSPNFADLSKTRGDNENYVPKNDGQAADGNDPAATVLTANYQKFTGVKETSLNETSASAVYSLSRFKRNLCKIEMAYRPLNPVFGNSYANTSTSSEGADKSSNSSCVSSHAGDDVSNAKVNSNFLETSLKSIHSSEVGWKHFEDSVGDKFQDLDEVCLENTANIAKTFLKSDERGAMAVYRPGCTTVFDSPESVRNEKSPSCVENRVNFCELTGASQACAKPQPPLALSTPTLGVDVSSQRLNRQNLIASISRRFEAMSLRNDGTPGEEMIRLEDLADSENWSSEEVEWLKTRSRRRSSAVFFYKSPAGKSPRVRELVAALNNRSDGGTPAPNSSISARDLPSVTQSSESANSNSPSPRNDINSTKIGSFVASGKKPVQKSEDTLSPTPNGNEFLQAIERIGRRANAFSPSYVDFAQSFVRRKGRGMPKRLEFE